VPSHFFVPDPEIFPQLEGLKLEADDKLIYVFDVDADSCKGNLTDLRRELHLSLAKGNPK
jgi:hypothetical protein